MNIKFNDGYIADSAIKNGAAAIEPELYTALASVKDGSGKGNDFLGWRDLPVDYDKEEFARIKAAAEKIRNNSEILVVIGIGGSYLGARAAIEFVKLPGGIGTYEEFFEMLTLKQLGRHGKPMAMLNTNSYYDPM
ncbi:MAG: LOG family protein, partial [Clostridia bacterium]|nr:LOG family protein [Clostridia bacterium]